MDKKQRLRYEMLVRVRHYGMVHKEVFSEAGAQLFARVTTALAAVDEHMKQQVVAKAEAGRVKAVTRAAVFDSMKTIALAARRGTGSQPGVNPFKMPARRSVQAEIAAARAFLQEAESHLDEFARLGLPPAFIS
jgi:ribosomal protein S20